MLLSKLRLCFCAVAMATSVLATGCQPQADSASQPAASQPAPNETVIYNKWEVETHRDHKDMNQRPPAEQKEYNDWRQKQPDRH